MKTKFSFLDVLVGATVVAVCFAVVLFVTSCAIPVKRAKPAPAVAQPATITKEVTGTLAMPDNRINAPALIDELDQSGCELQTLVYEEGKRRAIFTAQCRVIGIQE